VVYFIGEGGFAPLQIIALLHIVHQ